MDLFDRFRSDDDTTEAENNDVTIQKQSFTTEIRKLITNKRAIIGIKGEDERTIEYDNLRNGRFKTAEEWKWRSRGYDGALLNENREHNLGIRVSEWDTVLEVNTDYLKYIDPVWEREQTLVVEVEITYKEYEDGSTDVVKVEQLDEWYEEGDTTEA